MNANEKDNVYENLTEEDIAVSNIDYNEIKL